MRWRTHHWLYTFFAIMIAIFPIGVRAATVENLTDQPSSTQISSGSNHKFTFTVTSSIAEGSALSIVFPTGFTMSSITEDDVDVTDDGVDLTTSSDCSGTDQASVSVSGQTLQITLCAGDGGAIANSSVVVIEIGTNASASGSGTHRVTNPSAVSSYFISLSETGGNAGSVVFTTTTSGSTAVSATVPTASAPPDTENPENDCDGDYGNACTSANSCGVTDDGWIDCDGVCSAVTPSEDLCFSVCDGDYGNACTSVSNSCGMTDTGTIACDGSCSAVTPQDSECPVLCVSTYGAACTSSSNSCGMTDTGTIACDGSCSAVTPSENACVSSPVCSSRYGNACTSSANSCGMTNAGVIGCDDSCSAGAPAETSCVPSACAATYGDACTSSSNSCGMTNSGSVSCAGACSAETPAEDYCTMSASCAAHEGSACTSSANSCGMTNAGVFGCDGSCTAGTPSEGLCTMSTCADNEGDSCVSGQNSCGQVNEGIIGCNGACSAAAPAEKYCVPVVLVESVSGSSGIVETFERFREAPVTQTAVAVATPVAIVAAVSTVAVLTTSLNLLAYIQFIFTSPLMLIHRRKRKPFGIVYHAVTKVPVDLAVVRLYAADTNRLVKSAVTNAEGKYFFVVEPGQYRLSATKHDFVFPSTYLQDVKDDGVFLDVYTGQNIVVTAHDATIAANIPLDGAQGEHAQTPRGILVKKALRKLQFGLALSGSVLSVLVYILAPSWLTLGLAAGQVIIFCAFVRLARVKKPKGWGVVYDATTRRPVGKAIVRLFEPKYNKLVETTITDSLGRYSFLVGANEYFMRTSKEGYGEYTVNAIDYRQHAEPLPLAVDVPLTPEKPL